MLIRLLVAIAGSSIGKKFVMALTGLGAIGFLVVHLGGNLLIYGGRNEFNSYARHLHSLPFLPALEIGLFVMFALHAILGSILAVENWRARPMRYAMKKRAGGSNVASSTMIYSGAAVLVFLALHMLTIRSDVPGSHEAYVKVLAVFAQPFAVASYVLGVLALGFHLFHGASSTLQSLGLNHVKYERLITAAGRIGAAAFTLGFGSLPLYIALVLRRAG
jgi:succinate dehydrogenase / fumarate reductase cytochrome b subunit